MTRLSFLALTLLALAACTDESPASNTPAPAAQPEQTTETAPPSTPPTAEAPSAEPRMLEHAVTEAADFPSLPAGVGLEPGTAAPDAEVDDLEGHSVSLHTMLDGGSKLIVFYRGGWCPFCNFQVHELVEAWPEFQRRGITPVSISVDIPEGGVATRDAHHVPFPILSDPDLHAHTAFKVLQLVDDETLERYGDMGIDLEQASRRHHHTLAVPSIFLVDEGGVVRLAHADRDYRTRPSPTQILAAIDALSPAAEAATP